VHGAMNVKLKSSRSTNRMQRATHSQTPT